MMFSILYLVPSIQNFLNLFQFKFFFEFIESYFSLEFTKLNEKTKNNQILVQWWKPNPVNSGPQPCFYNTIGENFYIKVPFNWKARGYWPKSHTYLIGLNFRGLFPVVFGCSFLDNALLFWFLSKSYGFLASNLKFFFWTELYTRYQTWPNSISKRFWTSSIIYLDKTIRS